MTKQTVERHFANGRAGVLLAVLLLAGCGREQIAVYRVPKEEAPQLTETATSGGQSKPQLKWTTPAGWKEQTPSGMSIASFEIPGDAGHQAQLSVMTFPGEGAGELDLVNIVRGNAGLPALNDQEMARLVEPVNIGEGQGKLIDLTGSVNPSDVGSSNRILVAVYPLSGITWFFKLAGDSQVVLAQKPALLEFLKTVSFVATAGVPLRGPHVASTNAKPNPDEQLGGATAGGRPAWDLPAGWQEAPPSQMVLARFIVSGGTEVTVSSFGGEAGGLLANVNRWRGQVGLNPLDQAGAEKQATALDVLGGKAMLVDMSGTSNKTGQPARIIGAIVPREGQTWFFKMMGDPAVAEGAKAAFIKFVQTVRYPNA